MSVQKHFVFNTVFQNRFSLTVGKIVPNPASFVLGLAF